MRKTVFWGSLMMLCSSGSMVGCNNNQPATQQQEVGQVPAVPGQPAAVPAVPGQPAAVPGQVTAAPAQAQAAVPPTATGDVLVDKLNTKKVEASPDTQPTSTLLKQSLAAGKSQAYQVPLAGPPYCQTFIATAADTVKNIDLRLASPTGAEEASDGEEGSVAVIANHCPAVPGMYTLTVSMPGGAGEYAVQVFSK